ncbi:MAG: GntR family transcriptional regulator [Clostridiales bacterium]|jgi:GntR family transcriptional regulator|nr:GntR family transcriptional regulator [Clostridiales bacterium]
MLESTRELPLYLQLSSVIRKGIENGEYKSGEKIPTEAELGRLHNVSRITVRNALDALTKEGILTRKRGKGTFVADNKIVRDISGIQSFTRMCRRAGFKPGAKVIKCILEPATKDDIKTFNLNEGDNVMAIERIRSADNIPVSFEVSRFPGEFSFLLHEDLNNSSMFQILEEKYKIRLSSTNKFIELCYATKEMAVYLNLKESYPLILISALSSDENGRPLHLSSQYIVGDKIKLTV